MMVSLSSRGIKTAIALCIASLLSLVWGESFTGRYWIVEDSDLVPGWYGELPFADYPSELVLERLADTVSGLLHYRGTVYALEAEVADAIAWGQLATPHGVMGAALWYRAEPLLLTLSIVDIDATGEPQYQLSQTFVFSDTQVSTSRSVSYEPEPYLATAQQLCSNDAGVREQAADELFDALPAALPVVLAKAAADDWRAREGAARVFSRLPELTWVNRLLLHDDDAAVRRVVLDAFDGLGLSELLTPYLDDLTARLADDSPELRALAFRIIVWNTVYLERPEPGQSYSPALLARLEPALPQLLATFDTAGPLDQRTFLDMVMFLGSLIQEVTPLLTRLSQDAAHLQHTYAVSLLAHLKE